MGGVGEREVWGIIKKGNAKEVEKSVEREKETKTDQEIQLDWNKIEKSQFCEECINRKLNTYKPGEILGE